MEQKILEAILSIDKRLSELAQDIKEIKQKLSEHDNKFDTIAETLENVFNSVDDINNRLDVLALDTFNNRAEINKLKKVK
jgi:septation ring formation regulator EzrA